MSVKKGWKAAKQTHFFWLCWFKSFKNEVWKTIFFSISRPLKSVLEYRNDVKNCFQKFNRNFLHALKPLKWFLLQKLFFFGELVNSFSRGRSNAFFDFSNFSTSKCSKIFSINSNSKSFKNQVKEVFNFILTNFEVAQVQK